MFRIRRETHAREDGRIVERVDFGLAARLRFGKQGAKMVPIVAVRMGTARGYGAGDGWRPTWAPEASTSWWWR
jgi:hypothetical protein